MEWEREWVTGEESTVQKRERDVSLWGIWDKRRWETWNHRKRENKKDDEEKVG